MGEPFVRYERGIIIDFGPMQPIAEMTPEGRDFVAAALCHVIRSIFGVSQPHHVMPPVSPPSSGADLRKQRLSFRNELLRTFVAAHYEGSSNDIFREFDRDLRRYISASWQRDRGGQSAHCDPKRQGLFAIAEAFNGKALGRTQFLKIFGVEKTRKDCGLGSRPL